MRSCTLERLYRLPGFYLQHVPFADREQFTERFLVAPSATVWDLCMPSQLGGTRRYLQIINGLKRNKGTFPSFFLEDLEAHRKVPRFDSSEYICRRAGRDARLTCLWGWNRRDSSLTLETSLSKPSSSTFTEQSPSAGRKQYFVTTSFAN